MTDAKKIAEIIQGTDTDLRGNLFAEVALELRKQSQGFTCSLFIKIASEYGIKSPPPKPSFEKGGIEHEKLICPETEKPCEKSNTYYCNRLCERI
jgi:hypothetical protein